MQDITLSLEDPRNCRVCEWPYWASLVSHRHRSQSGPQTRVALPMPADAMLILPGLALAKAINSGTVLAGNDEFTTTTRGMRMSAATGASFADGFCLTFWPHSLLS